MESKYWEWEFVKDEKSKVDNGAGEIKFHPPADLEKNLEEARKNCEEALKDAKNAKKNRAGAGEKTEEERKKIEEEFFSSDREYVLKKSLVSTFETILSVTQRNRGMYFKVKRIKDRYSRKEGLAIDIYRDGMQDGKIVTSIGSLDKDIFRLEEFGVYLTPTYYGDLSKIISDHYFDLEALEQKFIGNDVPEIAVKKFAQLCYESILDWLEKDSKSSKNTAGENSVKGKKDAKNTEKESQESVKDVTLDSKGEYYHVHPSIIEKCYENSDLKSFKLSSLKEALIIYGYAKANAGRNDLNVAKKGRVISLNKKELEKVGMCEDD